MATDIILGICGFIGSGKGTVGEYLVSDYGFRSVSFAGTLKDTVSSIFSWDRHLLEGDTAESREWRELKDPWWSHRLGRYITPRLILQEMGTDVMRNNFSNDIWMLSLERKIEKLGGNIVITDLRFENEINMIKSMPNGKTVWVKRKELPEWYNDAVTANQTNDRDIMITKWANVHESEWAWVGRNQDYIIENSGSLEDLYDSTDLLLNNIREDMKPIEE